MEEIVDRITESLALTDAEERYSLSIFDENDSEIFTVGKPKATEREARTIRQCLKSSWRNSVRIKIGKVNFLCLRVPNTLLGHGNFNEPNIHGERLYSETHEKTSVIKSCENEKKDVEKSTVGEITLSAVIVKDLVVILVGQGGEKESFLKAAKDIADIVQTSLKDV